MMLEDMNVTRWYMEAQGDVQHSKIAEQVSADVSMSDQCFLDHLLRLTSQSSILTVDMHHS